MKHSNLTLLVMASALASLSLTVACGGPPLPAGADCAEVFTPGGGRGLEGDLARAEAGDCVVLDSHTYRGSFLLPAGVQLLAGQDRLPVLESGEADAPVLRVEGGEGTRVAGLQIVAEGGQGLDLRDGPASLEQLTVTAPGEIGLYLGCPTAGCSPDATVEVLESRVHDSQIGLWVDGLHAITAELVLEDNVDSGAIVGYGALVTGGGRLESSGDRFAQSGGMGLLADGAATSVELSNPEVVDNEGPGIWVQGLQGSLTVPALAVDGPSATISGNAKAGLGSVDTVGIIMGTCIVRDTRPVPWPEGGGTVFQVGDGVALLAGSGDVTLGAGTALSSNDRAQLLVDQGGANITVNTTVVDPGSGRYGVVVQNTSGNVDFASGVAPEPTAGELGVDDGMQTTP